MERDDRPPVATFFAPETPRVGEPASLGAETAHHVRVRRMALGDRVRLVDGQGTVAVGAIGRLAKHAVIVDVERAWTVDPPPAVHMLVPVADRERMLWLAEKCAELGAASWRPVLWRRSHSVSPRGEGPTFREKIRARMVAALEQSGGAWLPLLFPEAPPDRALAATPPGTHLLLDPAGTRVLGTGVAPPASIAVGPEGGLESAERALFVDAGWIPVSLARSILRFETAGTAALAIARAALEVPHDAAGAESDSAPATTETQPER